jgi:sugar lactone lactonase YvrE
MKPIAFLVLFALFCQPLLSQDKTFQSDRLIKKWETPKEFFTPESVCYNPELQVLYVANINGKGDQKDGNGFISTLSLLGEVEELRWVSGLNAPKGMGIYNGKLYVADIDRVAMIDIKNKKIEKFYEFPESKGLNDIAVDQFGAIYISDKASTSIYRIFNNKAEMWLDDKILAGPNGLFVENDKLMIGCGKIVLADLKDKKIINWLEKTGGIDGLEGAGDGRYLFSDWSGNVYLVDTDRKIEKILDTTTAGINAADIEFIPSLKLLLVPTFNDNRVMAYEFKN